MSPYTLSIASLGYNHLVHFLVSPISHGPLPVGQLSVGPFTTFYFVHCQQPYKHNRVSLMSAIGQTSLGGHRLRGQVLIGPTSCQRQTTFGFN